MELKGNQKEKKIQIRTGLFFFVICTSQEFLEDPSRVSFINGEVRGALLHKRCLALIPRTINSHPKGICPVVPATEARSRKSREQGKTRCLMLSFLTPDLRLPLGLRPQQKQITSNWVLGRLAPSIKPRRPLRVGVGTSSPARVGADTKRPGRNGH